MAQPSNAKMHVAVLADTHIRSEPPGSCNRWLPPGAERHLETADVILHAGDVVDAGVLERLRSHAPVYAVLGNNDRDLVGVLAETLVLDLAGVRVGMVHDSGRSAGRARRLNRRFPDAQVVVFGHSHAPVAETGENGQLLFNPGSPTQRRRQPRRSLGRLILGEGRILDRRIIHLD